MEQESKDLERLRELIQIATREKLVLEARIDQLSKRNQQLENEISQPLRLAISRLRSLGDRLTGGGLRSLNRRVMNKILGKKNEGSYPMPTRQKDLTFAARLIYTRLMAVARDASRIKRD